MGEAKTCRAAIRFPPTLTLPRQGGGESKWQVKQPMRVVELSQNPLVYTCRSYLLLGEWNRIDDVNTLIDPGVDNSVLAEIEALSTGFGKRAVERIILTHNHFDHAASATIFKRHFDAKVYAWCDGDEVDELLDDGQILKAGDSTLQVLHTPGHSSDSICLYCQEEKILFSGDTQLTIRSVGGAYPPEYLETLKRLAALRIDRVYSGHDWPLKNHVHETILQTLANVRKSRIE